MARGVRKSPMEKLKEELEEVQAAISQYQNCLETMQERERALLDQIQMEQFKAVSELLKERDMTMEDLKAMLEANDPVTLTA